MPNRTCNARWSGYEDQGFKSELQKHGHMTTGHRLVCREIKCSSTTPCRPMPLLVHFTTTTTTTTTTTIAVSISILIIITMISIINITVVINITIVITIITRAPAKRFPTKSPWVKLSGRLPTKFNGHEHSHPLEFRVCWSQTPWNPNS